MDRETQIRTAVAVVLCAIIFFAWQYFLAPVPPPTPIATDSGNTTQAAPEAIVNVPVIAEGSIVATSEQPVVVDMQNYQIAFDAQSGDVRSLALSKFTDATAANPTFTRVGIAGNYATFDFGLSTGYTYALTDTQDGKVATFTAESGTVRVTKRYHLKDNEYLIPMDVSIENLSDTAFRVPMRAVIGAGLGTGFEPDKYTFNGAIIRNLKTTEKEKEDKVDEDIVLATPQWGGYTSKYFLFSVFAGGFESATIKREGISAVVELNGSADVAPAATYTVPDLAIYAGPKDYNTLKAFGNNLQKSIDYGMFFFLAIPMSKLMNFFHSFVGNYGVAIILLTIVVKLLTLPLTMKSMKSMKGMSKLQPEMLKLKEKYKDEPQKMQAATMELYRTHKVNPMSGCLPLIVQIPIFFALYKTLLVSIELKGAPFIFWLTDLSMKDPYYITPILMGATMFLQQLLTPSTVDPMQKKMFMMMPVVFTFLFLSFPSGLVIYWLTNNILSIAQQYAINKTKD
ncbi:MAG: membrane protein insertase YidC [Deferribacteraceae bacterium]|nr:membrane protein insertase YidC [Deferribacteraceae bacterium]